ncbi:MAG: hypothetical protein ACO1NO_02470 [Burkholderiaceae bacterium]
MRIQPGTAYLTSFYLVENGKRPSKVEVTSIAAPPGKVFPANTIVLPYGGKAREQLAVRVAADARKRNQELYQLEVGVDIDRLRVKILTLSSLQTTALLNMKLLGKCIEATIIDYWCDYLEEEGMDVEWVIAHLGRDVRAYVAMRPDLLGRLSQEKEFRHLNMIVFTLPAENESIDVGMILHRHAITQSICNTDPSVSVIV